MSTRILWVDDEPQKNKYYVLLIEDEFEESGQAVIVDEVQTINEAAVKLMQQSYKAVILDQQIKTEAAGATGHDFRWAGASIYAWLRRKGEFNNDDKAKIPSTILEVLPTPDVTQREVLSENHAVPVAIVSGVDASNALDFVKDLSIEGDAAKRSVFSKPVDEAAFKKWVQGIIHG